MTSTGSAMIEPRRAIGSPSAERMVRLGAAIGPSERDRGAVIISQTRISRKISRASLIALLDHPARRDNGGWDGGLRSGGAARSHRRSSRACQHVFGGDVKRSGRICAGGDARRPARRAPVTRASAISAMAGAVCRP